MAYTYIFKALKCKQARTSYGNEAETCILP